jgi:hypothetical protein
VPPRLDLWLAHRTRALYFALQRWGFKACQAVL